VGGGAQADLVEADLEQPVRGESQQPLAGAQAFAQRVDEQRPDRTVGAIGVREADELAFELGDPARRGGRGTSGR